MQYSIVLPLPSPPPPRITITVCAMHNSRGLCSNSQRANHPPDCRRSCATMQVVRCRQQRAQTMLRLTVSLGSRHCSLHSLVMGH